MKNLQTFDEFLTEAKKIEQNPTTSVVYHTSRVPLRNLSNTPMWFAVDPKDADWYFKNMADEGGSFLYKAEAKGKLLTIKDAKKLFKKSGMDWDEWTADIVSNPTAETVDSLDGTRLIKGQGYDGVYHEDYNPADYQKDTVVLLIFDPKKTIKGVTLQKSNK